MNKRTESAKPPESDEEKIVNFLGIKQRWWRTTSLLHAVLIGLYSLWYLICIHLGAFLMMIHDRYREWRDGQIRAAKEAQHAAEEETRAAKAATAVLLREREALQAWNERRLHALETGVPFDEPMPNGTNGAAVEQLRQEQSEFHAWYERRIEAAEKGEPFDEPPPNGTP